MIVDSILTLMKSDRVCPHCHVKFEMIEGRVFANHVRWCDQNTTNGDKGRTAIKASLTGRKRTSNSTEIVPCEFCQQPFPRSRNRKHLVRYCSKSCASHRKQSSATRVKISLALKGTGDVAEHLILCIHCSTPFKPRHKDSKFCSHRCVALHTGEKRREGLEAYRKYWLECQFKFPLQDYPDEFDMTLLAKHGMYKAKNRGDNVGGVSRDHMLSIRQGYDEGIDPKIISHPANCRLVLQSENVSKGRQSVILFDQLLERISEWNVKYRR